MAALEFGGLTKRKATFGGAAAARCAASEAKRASCAGFSAATAAERAEGCRNPRESWSTYDSWLPMCSAYVLFVFLHPALRGSR